ncbi:IclR family transcriptional regulator [Kordiimonas pumila]|uniref:IclR family transcriptional regulator n=1 Tax=Kordiimonas pumila TaxID=2161677 RepID=A0ABV7D7M0_9PROT|nr:IclR family transcriptional regulator [Kordiimonas pumila]
MSRRGKPSHLNPEEKRGIQSIDVGIGVLNAVASFLRPASLKELSDVAGMPASKVHRYLTSFIRTGLIAQDPISGRYDLGPQALQLGLSAIARLDIVDIATRHMAELTAEYDIMSLLNIWGDQGPTVIRIKRSTENIFSSIALGAVLPPLRSATGLAFLAHLPEEMTKIQIDKGLKEAKKLENTGPKTKRELADILNKVRTQGYSTGFSLSGTANPSMSAIAVPLLDIQGEASAVICLMSGLTDLTDMNNGIAHKLIEVCKEASLVTKSNE